MKNLTAGSQEPPRLNLLTARPLQRDIIKTQYLNDDALDHRFFNTKFPSAPFALRVKLAESMAAIS